MFGVLPQCFQYKRLPDGEAAPGDIGGCKGEKEKSWS
jgi:hypothetical protein